MMEQNILINRTIEKIQIAEDKLAINFVTSEGEVLVRVDADCCSYTWIEHIELPALGFPALVVAVNDLEMPDLGNMEEYEVIAYYGCKISTDKGDIVIDYRNSSNGYYGGSLSWPTDDYYYGGVYSQAVSENNWIDVVKDI